MSPLNQSSDCVLVDVEIKPNSYGSPTNSDCSSVILKMTNTPNLICSSIYSCSVKSCKSKFRRRADLVRHKASIHGPKASCLYSGCKYATGRKDKMKEHIVKIHKRPGRDTQPSPDPMNDDYENRSYPAILPKVDASNQTLADFPNLSYTSSRDTQHSPDLMDDHYETQSYHTILPKVDALNQTFTDHLVDLPNLSYTPSPSSDTSSMNMPSSYSGSSIFDTLDFDTASTPSSMSSFDGYDSFSTSASDHTPNNQSDFYGIGNWAEEGLYNDWSSTWSFGKLDLSTKSSFDTTKFEMDFCRYEDAFSHFFSAEILALA